MDVSKIVALLNGSDPILNAIMHDPVFYDVNTLDDVQWQVLFYQEQLSFLTSEFPFRMWARKKPPDDPFQSHTLRQWASPRSVVTLRITDRDRQFILMLAHRTLGFLPWPATGIGSMWMLKKGHREVVTSEEAVRLGRDGARREHILRVAEFIRTELREFLLGGCQTIRDAEHLRRAHRRKGSGHDFLADESARWDAAIARRHAQAETGCGVQDGNQER